MERDAGRPGRGRTSADAKELRAVVVAVLDAKAEAGRRAADLEGGNEESRRRSQEIRFQVEYKGGEGEKKA